VYRIRLPSGREAAFATIEELALAIQRGDVSREALIYHRLSDQWVPIERHPHFQGKPEPAESGPPAPPPPTSAIETVLEPAPPPPPRPASPPPAPAPEVIAPTPFPVRASPRPPAASPPDERPAPEPPRRDGTLHDEAAAPAPRRSAARGVFRLLLLAGLAAAGWYGWQWWEARQELAADPAAPAYRPAPPPSTLLRPDEPDTATPAVTPAPVSTARSDPRAPVGVAELIARHAAAVAQSRAQLASEIETVGFPLVFGVNSFASPLGARAARRRIASAANVIGQFHRRAVLLDQAYGDTAVFQTTRAGWSEPDRRAWETRPVLREPFASADLAESLLADADSVLAILGNAAEFELRSDTIAFPDPARAAAYAAQRRRLLERSGPPIEDFDRRPTLFLVRRSLDPARLPVLAP
jgi:hypothetical protein